MMARLIGPFVSRSSIQAKVRTSTLIQSGSSTQPNRSARQPDVRRVRASAIGKPIASVIAVTTSATTNVFRNTLT